MKNQQWISVSNPCEIKLDLDIEFEFADKNCNAVIVRDANGNTVKIMRQDYSMKVFVPTPPPTVEKYRLTGTIFGDVAIEKTFDDEYDADKEKQRILIGMDGKCLLTVEKIQVPA